MTTVRLSDRSTWRVVTIVVSLAAATVLLLGRQTGMPALLSMWAEDGWFLRDALASTSWFQPFAGYLHLVPRIVASLAAGLPLEWASVVLSGGAAMLTAVVAIYIYRATNGLIVNRTLRLWIAAMTLLLPAVAFESMNNIANSQVFLQYGCAWALLSRPTTRSDRTAGVVMVLAATLSSPLSVLLAPLVLLRRDRVIALAWLGGCAIQVMVIVAAGGTQGPIQATLGWLPELYALRILLGAGLGIRLADEVWRLFGHGAAILAIVAVIAVAAYAVKHPNRGPVTLLFATSVALFVAGFTLRWSDAMIPTPDSLGLAAARLTVVPTLLVLSAVALILDGSVPSWLVQAALVVSVFIVGIDYFSVGNRRDASPDWRASIDNVRQQCSDGLIASVPIAPPGWSVEIPCARLVDRH